MLKPVPLIRNQKSFVNRTFTSKKECFFEIRWIYQLCFILSKQYDDTTRYFNFNFTKRLDALVVLVSEEV